MEGWREGRMKNKTVEGRSRGGIQAQASRTGSRGPPCASDARLQHLLSTPKYMF